ncbi:MAG: hypothetical protein ISR76_07440, partial [Planctomycetes bacterium]|nr:hypothetical protein [Planctomycetota bacterium]
ELRPAALQPRAASGATLAQLRDERRGPALWHFRGQEEPSWLVPLEQAVGR